MAQDALPAQTEQAGESDAPADQGEIRVTGSRIVTNGNDQPTPVTVLGAEQLLESRPTLPVEALAQVPSLSTSTTRNSIGGSSALGPGSFLNLRGLGANRTLVLLDGRRMAPSTNQGTVDASLLPSMLIQRVEVVTGGASAAYGSDAVSGVVNFILDDKFTGWKGDVSYGQTSRDDVRRYHASLAWGVNLLDDRLHIMATGEYFKSGGIGNEQGNNREFLSRRAALIANPAVTAANPASATNPRFLIEEGVTWPYATFGGLIVGGPLDGTDFGPGGVPRPLAIGTLKTANAMVGGGGGWFSTYINYSSAIEMYNLFGRATLDVSPDTTAYVQVMYGDNRGNYIQDPPFQTQANNFTIYAGNPFIPSAIATRMANENIANFKLARIDIDWPFIHPTSGYKTLDLTAGLKGRIGAWNWEAYVEHGVSHFDLEMRNEPNLKRLYEAADVVRNPANGQPICRTTLLFDPNNGCVPLNLFGPNSASQEALAYVTGTLWAKQELIQNVVAANVSGPLFDLWAGPVQLGFGVEHRTESGEADSDPIAKNPIVAGNVRGIPAGYIAGPPGGWQTNNPQPLKGDFSIWEGYGEVLVPLAHDTPLFHSLDLNAAGRITNYSTSGRVYTWKVGLVWEPIPDIRLRATRSRDIRAPNISELFAGNAQSYVTVNDPENNNVQVVNVTNLRRGNPSLDPEFANTLTIGAVLQPRFLPGFSVSADWYDIKIAGSIAQLGAQDEVTLCFQGNAEICRLITRAGGLPKGQILIVETPSLNLQQLHVRGVDAEVGYRTSLGAGTLSMRALATYVGKVATTSPTATGFSTIDRAGDITTSSQPKFRVFSSVGYEIGRFDVSVNGRYIGSGKYNTTYTPIDISAEDQHIPSVIFVDLNLQYKFSLMGGEQTAYLSISNLFDQAPPLAPANNFNASQTPLGLYNIEGMAFTAGFRFKF